MPGLSNIRQGWVARHVGRLDCDCWLLAIGCWRVMVTMARLEVVG